MKCHNCNFISFDYNETCPKCNKSISDERDILGFQAYKSTPPALLQELTGKAGIPGDEIVNAEMFSNSMTAKEEIAVNTADSQAIEAMEATFQNSQELEIELEEISSDQPMNSSEMVDLSTNLGETSDLVEDNEISLSIDDLSIDNHEDASYKIVQTDENDIVFDQEFLSPESDNNDAVDIDPVATIINSDEFTDEPGQAEDEKDQSISLDLDSLELDLEIDET